MTTYCAVLERASHDRWTWWNFLDLIISVGLLVLNSGALTVICRSAASTVIHLAPVSERCSYEWNRHADTAGSDHHAITLLPCYPYLDVVREYRVVQWQLFRESCVLNLRKLCQRAERRAAFLCKTVHEQRTIDWTPCADVTRSGYVIELDGRLLFSEGPRLPSPWRAYHAHHD
ncbi:hypothetical protein MRX96_033383 [Rhipicephalus microplus]